MMYFVSPTWKAAYTFGTGTELDFAIKRRVDASESWICVPYFSTMRMGNRIGLTLCVEACFQSEKAKQRLDRISKQAIYRHKRVKLVVFRWLVPQNLALHGKSALRGSGSGAIWFELGTRATTFPTVWN